MAEDDWITNEELKMGIYPNPGQGDLGGPAGRGTGGRPIVYQPKGGKKEKVGPEPLHPAAPGEYGVFGEQYHFTPEDLVGQAEYLTRSPTDVAFTAKGRGKYAEAQWAKDPGQLTPQEYDTLTKEASKGNKLAQQILVSGHYQEHPYPSLRQDLASLEDPFVKAMSGLPALGENLATASTLTTLPYTFTHADAQVNNILASMGTPGGAPAPSAATTAYANKLQGIVGTPSQFLNNAGPMGLPSIETALSAMGPAGKLAEEAAPTQALVSALLSHLQYETIYGGLAPSSKGEPGWLQQLIASVTGATSTGGLPSPQTAASALGALPSTGTSPIPNA